MQKMVGKMGRLRRGFLSFGMDNAKLKFTAEKEGY